MKRLLIALMFLIILGLSGFCSYLTISRMRSHRNIAVLVTWDFSAYNLIKHEDNSAEKNKLKINIRGGIIYLVEAKSSEKLALTSIYYIRNNKQFNGLGFNEKQIKSIDRHLKNFSD